MQRTAPFLGTLAALLLIAAAPAAAQDYRAPVAEPEAAQKPARDFMVPKPPVRMEFKDKAPARQAEPPPNGANAKFPNIDTAKNRKDYEMGTEGAGHISVGRDEESGDTTLSHSPPKKSQQAQPGQNMPIEVRPIVKGYGGTGS